MTAVADLLDAVKASANFNSDNGLAERLNLRRQNVHQWRHGLAPIPDERIAQICELAKLDGAVWVAKIHAERATSPVERKVWKSVLDRLSAAATVLVLVVVTAPGAARANPVEIQGVSGGHGDSMYIMLQRALPIRTPASPVLAASCPPFKSPQRPQNLAPRRQLLTRHAGTPV